MLTRAASHMIVGLALATVGGVAAANALGLVGLPRGTASVELLEGGPVPNGDLGEVLVVAGLEPVDRVLVARN